MHKPKAVLAAHFVSTTEVNTTMIYDRRKSRERITKESSIFSIMEMSGDEDG